jgi:hypothetical protein
VRQTDLKGFDGLLGQDWVYVFEIAFLIGWPTSREASLGQRFKSPLKPRQGQARERVLSVNRGGSKIPADRGCLTHLLLEFLPQPIRKAFGNMVRWESSCCDKRRILTPVEIDLFAKGKRLRRVFQLAQQVNGAKNVGLPGIILSDEDVDFLDVFDEEALGVKAAIVGKTEAA